MLSFLPCLLGCTVGNVVQVSQRDGLPAEPALLLTVSALISCGGVLALTDDGDNGR